MKNRRYTLRSWVLEQLESLVRISFAVLLVVSLTTGHCTAGPTDAIAAGELAEPLSRLVLKSLFLNNGIGGLSVWAQCARQAFLPFAAL